MLKKGMCGPPASGNPGDCTYWGQQIYNDAIASQPDIVTIMLGTNDAKYFNWENVQQNLGDYFALDYIDLINQFKALKPNPPRIMLMIPPPLGPGDPIQMNGTVINTIFPSLIRNIAAVAGGLDVIDVQSQLKGDDWDSKKITCDGCHPNDSGYDIIASYLAPIIKKVGESIKPTLEATRLEESGSPVEGCCPTPWGYCCSVECEHQCNDLAKPASATYLRA
jgi:lysophospholipase L1-like esterase